MVVSGPSETYRWRPSTVRIRRTSCGWWTSRTRLMTWTGIGGPKWPEGSARKFPTSRSSPADRSTNRRRSYWLAWALVDPSWVKPCHSVKKHSGLFHRRQLRWRWGWTMSVLRLFSLPSPSPRTHGTGSSTQAHTESFFLRGLLKKN